ncbi:MAG: UDP-N-acetylmuramoyl-tripeptide--D-alanyl-D-alanine ligase [bacterium]
MKLSLKHIYNFLGIEGCENNDQTVLGVSTDSRSVKKGELFFALKGENFNGHQFIEESLNKGAVAVVTDKNYSVSERIKEKGVVLQVDDTLTALQQIAKKYRAQFDIPVIAITGSNGKTTTKEMIAEILSTRFKTVKSQGNYNNHIGVPLSILQWDDKAEVAVMELGANHFGEINKLCNILNPTHGVITNIGKAHLGFFHSLEGVTKAKKELIEYLVPDGYAFLNGDDPFLYPLRNICENTVLFGFSNRCKVRGENSRIDSEGYPSMKVGDKKIKLMIPGMHNLSNALAGISVAKSLQVKDEDIFNTLTNYHPIEKRMNIVYAGTVKVINDTYNANPSSMLESLKTLKIITSKGGRSIAVIGDMMELGSHSKSEHRNIGEKSLKIGIDALFCYGEMGEYVYEGALHAGMKNIYYYYDKARLLEDLNSFIRKGDIVLVKGSRAMKMEEIIRGMNPN